MKCAVKCISPPTCTHTWTYCTCTHIGFASHAWNIHSVALWDVLKQPSMWRVDRGRFLAIFQSTFLLCLSLT